MLPIRVESRAWIQRGSGSHRGDVGERPMATRIIDRGRGPEIEGTRVTIYRVMDFVRAGDPRGRIAEELDLTDEQVGQALDYIDAHRDEVEAEYQAIVQRVSGPNPDWVEAGSARTWEELR